MSARPVVKTSFMDAAMQEASIMAAQVRDHLWRPRQVCQVAISLLVEIAEQGCCLF